MKWTDDDARYSF